ncbi:MAG: hypothetical protein KAG14_01630 [Mycoplasmataceae bacterium]|nr:hypothetical protein [Mycoplasmataceae bacterium]
MEWLTNFNIYVQGAILMGIVFSLLLAVLLILYVFKIKIKKERMKYVFAFSSGFLLVTAIIGQWVVARHELSEHWVTKPNAGETIISISVVVSGIIIGTLFAYILKKKTIHSHMGELQTHDDKTISNHPTAINTQAEIIKESAKHKHKTPVIYMILAHRMPAGILMGILLVNLNGNGTYSLGALVAFIIHIIPEVVIVYYSRIEAGYSRKQAFIFSVFAQLFVIPFVFIGIVLSNYIGPSSQYAFWIIPLMLSMAGIVMVWAAIFELAPAFIEIKDNKSTYKLIITFMIGLTASLIIQFLHAH